MAAATVSETESAECSHCDGPRDPHASVHGSFCSTQCWLAHKGEKALEAIQQDHRFCATCYRQIKEVERPSDEQLAAANVPKSVRQAFVGFQYPTPHTAFVEDLKPIDAGTAWDSPRRKVRGVFGCECGTIDHRVSDDTLQSVEGGAVLLNLLQRLAQLYAEERVAHPPSKERLFGGLSETHDLEYAVGHSLYGSEA